MNFGIIEAFFANHTRATTSTIDPGLYVNKSDSIIAYASLTGSLRDAELAANPLAPL